MNKTAQHAFMACAAALLPAALHAADPAATGPPAQASTMPTPAAPSDQRRTGYVLDTSTSPFMQTSDGRKIGDPFPVFWDGVWHLYTLSAPVGKVLHFTSTDLVKWVEHQPAMIRKGVATGTVLRHDGKYYLFYTDEPAQTIHLVISDNPWEFDPGNSRLVAEADGKTYNKGWFRDAYVFHNEEENLWWMLIEGRAPEVCTGLFRSQNLLEWQQCEPIFKDQKRAFGSCPQIFKQDKLWYLACQDYPNWYYTSDTAHGPWTLRGYYQSAANVAASRFATDGKRQLAWGWFSGAGYGGPLGIGREMVFNNDGTMGVRPLPELLAAIRNKQNKLDFASVRKLSGEWKVDPANRTLQCIGESGGTVLVDLPEKNPNYYFEAELEFGSPQTNAGIVVRSSENIDRGYRIALGPATKKIAISGIDPASKPLNERDYAFPEKNSASLQVFVCDNHMEAFVDGRTSLSVKVADRSCYKMAIGITGGPATIRKPFLHYFKNENRQ